MDTDILTIIKISTTALAYIIYYIGRYLYKKKNIMISLTISSLIMGISNYFHGSLTGLINSTVSSVRGLVVCYKDKYNKKMYWCYILFFVICIINVILTYENIASLIVVLSSLIVLTSVWFSKNEQTIRIAGGIASALSAIYLFLIKNYLGVGFETVAIIANITSWIKYYKETKEYKKYTK